MPAETRVVLCLTGCWIERQVHIIHPLQPGSVGSSLKKEIDSQMGASVDEKPCQPYVHCFTIMSSFLDVVN